MIAYTFPLLDVVWSMLVFFGLLVWIWLFATIFVDLIRSRDIGGWSKAGWFLLVLVFPLVGSLIYLVARGRSMHERVAREAEAREAAFRRYVHDAAASGAPSTADELSKLVALREKGAITDEEFEEQKSKVLSARPEAPQRTAA